MAKQLANWQKDTQTGGRIQIELNENVGEVVYLHIHVRMCAC